VKYRTRTEQYRAPHTVDGETVEVTKTREVHVPVLPPDWDSVAIKAAAGLVLTLTVLSVVWSTWSIGSLLGGGVIGYMAAVIFDVSWATTLLLEWLARYDARKRRLPRVLGWALLLVTMCAIAAHGLVLKNPGMAVVGALVSAVAKVLWLALTRHIDRELSDDDQQWVATQVSQANAKMAVAGVRRQVARLEDRAAAELLAMEASRPATLRVEQDTRQTAKQQLLPEPAGPELSGQTLSIETPLTPYRSWTPRNDRELQQNFPDSIMNGSHNPVVYFAIMGNRVKIGTTTHLRNRIASLSLPPESIKRTVYGGRETEMRYHEGFAEYRIDNTEWFRLEGDLERFLTQDPESPQALAGNISSAGTPGGELDQELPESVDSRQVQPATFSGGAVRQLRPTDLVAGSERRTPVAGLADLLPKAAEKLPATTEFQQVSGPTVPASAEKSPGRISQVATVRQVAEELGTTDVAAVLPAVAARIGRQPNQETVTRELRRIRKTIADSSGNSDDSSGMYL
jgi:hypothetical protein